MDNTEEIEVNTPFGKPSDKITLGKIEGVNIAFIPRHGKGHAIPPHKVNYRANIFALKECGVEYLISTAAVGSLKKELKPLDFVIADQLIDRTAMLPMLDLQIHFVLFYQKLLLKKQKKKE